MTGLTTGATYGLDTRALLALWQRAPVGDAEAAAAFARHYADDLRVNGVPTTPADLVARARDLQRAFTDLSHEILERVETNDTLVIAFLLRGRHVGPWPGPDGPIEATGRWIEVRTVDVLRVFEGRIAAVTVVADELGLRTQLSAATHPTTDVDRREQVEPARGPEVGSATIETSARGRLRPTDPRGRSQPGPKSASPPP